MKQSYKSKMYEVSIKPQSELLGKDEGFCQKISEGGNFKCFQYHFDMQNALVRSILDCEMGHGSYSKLSKEQRVDEGLRLRRLQEAHHLKAQIFATSCGRTLF